MAAATLSDLQTWITTYAGPIIDAAMNLADTGPQGTAPVGDLADASQRTPLIELAHRIKAARAAGALPAAVVSVGPGGKWNGSQPSLVAQNWTNAIGTWTAPGSGAWSYPNW